MCIFVIFFIIVCLFVSNSQVIGCEDRLQNDLYCVEWGVKLYSIHLTADAVAYEVLRSYSFCSLSLVD